MRIQTLFAVAFGVALYSSSVARADDMPGSPEAGASDNYKKSERLLPGEEVRTPNGKTMKVWRTEGPVSAGKPPAPFEDKSQQLGNVDVVIDGRANRTAVRPPVIRDTFDLKGR